ncbi:hypothetical protein [Streptosporangium sp. NPDC000509]|uniref:hypothetical protein n=1 Tax=Streptosporangium sp. NPDC000509 TaxID=3366186 RepID=UPI0036B72967
MSKNVGPAIEKDQKATPSRSTLERVTVNLTPRSSRALEEAVEITGDTKTDTINRALQVYSYLERVLQNGGNIYVQEAGQTDQERLRFF